MDGLTYKYYRKNNTRKIFIILHGANRHGIESGFISDIFNAFAAKKNSIICFNFPFCERGERKADSSVQAEEINILKQVIDFAYSEGYTEITIIAKSFGGVISSYW